MPNVTLCHSFFQQVEQFSILLLLLQQTTTANTVCLARDFDIVNSTFFDVAVDGSPIHIRQLRGTLDFEQVNIIFAERTPNSFAKNNGVGHFSCIPGYP
jgi:hypothetical protein